MLVVAGILAGEALLSRLPWRAHSELSEPHLPRRWASHSLADLFSLSLSHLCGGFGDIMI